MNFWFYLICAFENDPRVVRIEIIQNIDIVLILTTPNIFFGALLYYANALYWGRTSCRYVPFRGVDSCARSTHNALAAARLSITNYGSGTARYADTSIWIALRQLQRYRASAAINIWTESHQFKYALTLLRNHYAGNVHLIVLISEWTAWMRFDLFPMSGRKALAKCVFM